MEPNQERSLIPRPSHELSAPQTAGNRILAGMVEETLALGRKESVAQTARFRIGDYAWCEPDYRQILLWAEAMDLEPLAVIEGLLAGLSETHTEDLPRWAGTRFEEGRIVSLVWNFDLLPLHSFEWVDELRITSLFLHAPRDGFGATRTAIKKGALPSLQ
jgi:hypothetical protein